jgi:hypothetical protein
MNASKSYRILTLLCLLLVTSVAWSRPEATRPGVHVEYSHPENFTEMRITPGSERVDINNDMALLKRYITRRAARVLAPGQQLDIVITDLALAGQYEPWPNSPTGWMRVVRRNYPPKIVLHFTLRDADGKVLKQGKRTLTNFSFMDTASIHDSDPVRYTKALIDRWLRRGVDHM